MEHIELLDCTLRDGGYINNWYFEKENINLIYNKLLESSVDYIELGYIDENAEANINSTKFSSFEMVKKVKPSNGKKICMIDYGKYAIEEIPPQEETDVWGIRIAFSKKDLKEALNYCKDIHEKGYKVFIQPMVTISYSQSELDYLLSEVNKIEPYAIYIVDSFGCMRENDIISLITEYKNKLKTNIKIGFHAHNNLQLAYPNAITFIENSEERNIIIDSSIYGMGRGAGNLCTELIAAYLNDKYKLECLLEVVDSYLKDIKSQKGWGYSIEYCLSAINKCHPNYAKFLKEIEEISTYDIKNILEMIAEDKKIRFDKEYIHTIYDSYLNNKEKIKK